MSSRPAHSRELHGPKEAVEALMASEQINVADPQALATQALIHYEIRDFCQQIASQFEGKAEAVASQLKDQQAIYYRQWWTTLRTHLLRMAEQHDKFGRNLDGASSSYQEVEPHNVRQFQGHVR
jgi:hypothetical protein